MTLAYIALGANLGDAEATVAAAIAALAELPETRLVAVSSLYRTAPVGLKNQPDFINAVVALEAALAPQPLLEALFEIEASLHQRAFVLAPLLEIAPDCEIPGYGAVRTLLDACHDQRITRIAECAGQPDCLIA